MGFGAVLGLLRLATAPVLVAFYHEPRLSWLTIAMAAWFVLIAAGVQHSALLQRELRFVSVVVIDTLSEVAGAAIGIGMAFAGFKYWALIVATIVTAAVRTAGAWLALPWIPGPLVGGLGFGQC
jgi:PST family polysaccharide transporter